MARSPTSPASEGSTQRTGSTLTEAAAPRTALEVRGVSKSYGAVEALSDVSFEVHAGTVLGLIGDNGAGKSTLIKCISGMLRPDTGSVLVDGHEIELANPEAARAAGIETVYQELLLVPPLDIATNLFLGRELISRTGC